MEELNNGNKKRGGCLTVFLIVYMALMIISIVVGFTSKNNQLASWAVIAGNVSRIAIVIGCIGTFMWKKWGVYLFSVGCTAYAVISAFGVTGGLKIANLVGSIIGLVVIVGILLLLIKPVWKHMD